MTDEQINIAIAGACGWRRCIGMLQPRHETEPKCWRNDNGAEYTRPPSYTTDLNAMHEAELSKPFSFRKKFRGFLRSVMSASLRSGLFAAWEELAHATARQRAEAFLRTIDKWEETP